MNDCNNGISLVGRDVNATQTHENRLINVNNDASSEDQHVGSSKLLEAPISKTVSKVCQLNDKIEYDDYVHDMLKNKQRNEHSNAPNF